MKWHILLLGLLTCGLVVVIVRLYIVEGFESSEEPNAIISLMGNLKRINGYLMDPQFWSHRIGLIGMTPVEMARQQLQSETRISKGNTE